jgi:phosphonatase-like hydrolase
MLLERYYPEKMLENEDLVNEIHVAFKQNLISFYESAIDLKPQTGAEQVFLWLRMHNIKVALNTGFPSSVTDIILQRLGWKNGDLIDQVISGDEVEEGRPAPFMINELMKRLGVENASEVVKVGDTEVDISEGRNARCGIVASVTTGACNRKQLEACGPDYVIDDLREIQVIIEKSGRTAGT